MIDLLQEEEVIRLFSYAEHGKSLTQIKECEYMSEEYFRKRYVTLFGLCYTKLRIIVSTFCVLKTLVSSKFSISAALTIERVHDSFNVPKSFYHRVNSIFRIPISNIIDNLEGDVNMQQEIKKFSSDSIESVFKEVDIAFVLERLNNTSKANTMTVEGIKRFLESKRSNSECSSVKIKRAQIRNAIVLLRKLGVPIISAFGRKGGYYIATKDNQALDEAKCLRIINNWRVAMGKSGLNNLIGV